MQQAKAREFTGFPTYSHHQASNKNVESDRINREYVPRPDFQKKDTVLNVWHFEHTESPKQKVTRCQDRSSKDSVDHKTQCVRIQIETVSNNRNKHDGIQNSERNDVHWISMGQQ